MARLVAHDAAIGRRDAAGAARIGADAEAYHAVGHRHRGARRRAAGNAAGLAVIGRPRRSVMRIEPHAGKGELRHVGAPDDDEPLGFEPGNRHRVGPGGRRIGQHPGARPRHLAGQIEQVLGRERNAGKPRRRPPGLAQAVDQIGGAKCSLRIDRDEGPGAFSGRIADGRERGLDQMPGRGAAVFEIPCQRRKRQMFHPPTLPSLPSPSPPVVSARRVSAGRRSPSGPRGSFRKRPRHSRIRRSPWS